MHMVPQFEGFTLALPPYSTYGAFILGLLAKGESPQQQPLVWTDVILFPTEELVWGPLLCSRLYSHIHSSHLCGSASWHWLGTLGSHLFWWDDRGSLWGCYALEHILIRGEIVLHLLLKFKDAPHQKVWFALSRWVNLFCPKLKGMGVCYHLLTLYLPDVPASKDGIGWWQEVLLAKAWQCRQSLMVILY